ncbi:MAG: DEAD/DEAH box helicase [Bacteroidota bacterium]
MVIASPIPERTAGDMARGAGSTAQWVGDRAFPHWLADDLAKEARRVLAERPGRNNRRRVRAAVQKRLWRWGRYESFAWEPLAPREALPQIDPGPVLAALAGRALFAVEAAAMVKHGGSTEGIERTLAELALDGIIQSWPSIEVLHLGRAICRRCGETQLEQTDCYACGDKRCWLCPSCRHLGLSTGCRTIYAYPRAGGREAGAFLPPAFRFTLTPAQQRAAGRLGEFIRSGTGEEFLVWAVCGAGKTEVVLTGIAQALSAGTRILVATPRRDVAGDLALRIASAFPGLALAVHYGGRHQTEESDPAVVVATTHQCLRFYEAFDLVILDEVDAFPFHGNRMLYAAVKRASRPAGRIVYLTATPPFALASRVADGTLPYVRLPVRPHGFPLPVPEFVRASLGRAGPGWRMPDVLAGLFTDSIARRHAALVFVPTVNHADWLGQAISRWGRSRGVAAASLHARDMERDEKRRAFADGRLKILVSTTVLERGLTLGALDVYILYADAEHVFDAASLIQMSGRAGRLAADPTGRVYFIAERIGAGMRAARAAIVAANDEAAREGFLGGECGCRQGISGVNSSEV